ncbi:Crp/Fnr family transcriptional regulator [Nonomuraea sp. NPDC050547]|uniref:Crp/Fnr family transcriptional regulator n=1 Tax=Nonomuraea sp. NPDC050547 TaxID=3364368 RepID=UPI00379C4B87
MLDKHRPNDRDRWARNTLLNQLGRDAATELLSLAPPRQVPAGTVLLHQGDASTRHAYVIRRARTNGTACVKITASLDNGAETLLGIRLCGDVIGELGAVRGTPRSATATTCSDVVVHAIRGEDFVAFLNRFPEGWIALSNIIADQLEWANQRRLDFTGYPVPVRLARVLLALVERHGGATQGGLTPGVTLSHDELGMLIGAGRDSIGQAIAKLKRMDLVRSSYRTVVINDLDRLRDYAAGPR